MKYKYWIISLLAIVMVGCSEPINEVAGSYSYKVSGKVSVDSLSVNLADEIGAMELIRRNDTTLLVTLNQMNGSVYTTEAVLREKTLILREFERVLTLSFPYTDSLGLLTDTLQINRYTRESFDISVSAIGEKLENTIVLTVLYNGHSQTSDAILRGEDIRLVAKKN